MYVIIKGRITISKQVMAGLDKTLTTLEEGDYFGEMSLLLNATRTATATALEDSTLIKLSREEFKQILKKSPEVGMTMLTPARSTFGQRFEGKYSPCVGTRTAGTKSSGTLLPSTAKRANLYRHRQLLSAEFQGDPPKNAVSQVGSGNKDTVKFTETQPGRGCPGVYHSDQ